MAQYRCKSEGHIWPLWGLSGLQPCPLCGGRLELVNKKEPRSTETRA